MSELTSLSPPTQIMGEGMNKFANARGLVMKQKVDLLEAVSQGCCEQSNTYSFYDRATGTPMFVVKEESGFCGRMCLNPSHEAKLHFHSTTTGKDVGQELFYADKPCKCCCLSFALMDICKDDITLYSVEGGGETKVGRVAMPTCGGGVTPKFNVEDKQGKEIGDITGPTCCIGSFCDTNFVYKSKAGGESVIQKEGVDGLKDAAKELFTDADNFTVTFTDDMTAETKATLAAAMLLLDYNFFEGDGNFSCNPLEKSCSIKCCDMYCCGYSQAFKCSCDMPDDTESGGGD